MSIDPVATAGLVTRLVRSGTRDGVPTRTVIARRVYATDQADLWNALTDPERIPRWFLPVSGELRPGGQYQLDGNAGGVVESCQRPEGFAVTWEYGGQVSWVRAGLTPDPSGGTVLEVAHEATLDDPAFWEQYGPGAGGVGWDLALMTLGQHLESGVPVNSDAAEDWTTSAEGIAFIRMAAGSWAEAAVADGDPVEQAREAAERTVTFYTVPPDGSGEPAAEG